MYEETFGALAEGATLITAGSRLARVLTLEFHSYQRSRGLAVWKTPDILPLTAYLERAWRGWLLDGLRDNRPTLLDPLQEQLVWESVIRDSPEGRSLLRIPDTARRLAEAWHLVQAYALPVDGRFEASDDTSAFARWLREFLRRCESNNWLDSARLGAFVADLAKRGEIAPPSQLFVAGFDELTPQQSTLFNALGDRQAVGPQACTSVVHRFSLLDSAMEIRAAATWARRMLAQNPSARIGIVAAGLTRARARVERILREVLAPGIGSDSTGQAFHVSLGPALDEYPLVRAALLLLEFGQGRLDLPQAGMLLRSPFIAGAQAEFTRRAAIDAKLRRNGVWDVTISRLIDFSQHWPELQRVLQKVQKACRDLPEQQRPSEWSATFARLLERAGWPGDRPLISREYQVVEAWQGLLSRFSALDLTSSSMTYDAAWNRLADIARQQPFQVENEGAPVQVMGLLEASGLRFDHLWILGLHDGALPAPANPNPFLPISLQREHSLPHSSAARELEFAASLLDRLLASAPDVVVSYPETEGDQMLSPAPLIAGTWERLDLEVMPAESWTARMRSGLTLDRLQDESAPPWISDTALRGGTYVFKDMSACPFKAFAVYRLGARPLDEAALGLRYLDRGNGVHKALELIWAALGSHANLLAATPVELEALIERSVEGAMQNLGLRTGQLVERRRLQRLLREWLEIEKLRAPFVVRKKEQDRTACVGGLTISMRVDRVDELEDGREIILDYKTGQLNRNAWNGDRPDEPQILVYCTTSARPPAGAALVHIRTSELSLLGLTDAGVSLPNYKEMNMTPPLPFGQQVAAWKLVLERLAEDFQAGRAAVDPKKGACEHCGQWAFCRVRELPDVR